MTIAVGDTLPEATLMKLGEKGPEPETSGERERAGPLAHRAVPPQGGTAQIMRGACAAPFAQIAAITP